MQNNNNQPFRRVFNLDSVFNERASPRSKLFNDFYGMMDSMGSNHTIFPQYHNRLHNFILDSHSRDNHPSMFPDDSPSTIITSPITMTPRSKHGSTSSSSSHMTTATSIPVVHIPTASTSDNSSSSNIRRTNTQSSNSSDSSKNNSTRSKETEAEVDALANILIKSIGKNSKDNVKPSSNGGSKIQMTVHSSPSVSSSSPSHQGAPYSNRRQVSPTPSTSSSTPSLSRQSTTTVSPGDCHRCRQPLEPLHNPHKAPPEPITGPLNTQFHQACFTCYRCNCMLSTDSFYYAQKRLLCPRCVQESLEKCVVCDLVINDRIIRVIGRPYHPKCFTCVACSRCLDGLPFTVDVHDRTYCLEDFHRRYAPRCDSCGQPIGSRAGQENRRIVSGRKNFHIDCFQTDGSANTPTSNLDNKKF